MFVRIRQLKWKDRIKTERNYISLFRLRAYDRHDRFYFLILISLIFLLLYDILPPLFLLVKTRDLKCNKDSQRDEQISFSLLKALIATLK